MKEQKLILLLAQALIGTGFFFLYIHHVKSIYENRTNVAHLTQIERDSMFRREDALYYSFYRTLTDAPDFVTGLQLLTNITTIEYPNSVNVLNRFHVLPEVVIGFLYHIVRSNPKLGIFSLLSCWRADELRSPLETVRCEGQSLQFYLECVWLLGGITVLFVYMYGLLLSRNIFGGIYAVASYIMFHSFAAKIYERPMARENFAFTAIFIQIFYLCICINKITEKKTHSMSILMTFKLTYFTAVALLCWQFSAIIFASQILILMLPWSISSVPNQVVGRFTFDYILSQLMGNWLAYYYSFGNRQYFFGWQLGPLVGLSLITAVRIFKRTKKSTSSTATASSSNASTTSSSSPPQQKSITESITENTAEFIFKTIPLGILISICSQGTLIDMLEISGIARPLENTYALYRDLIIHWGLQAKVNFVTSLAACNPDYRRMEWHELWPIIKNLVVKPYCLYGVVIMARFFRKWRKSTDRSEPKAEIIERAKKYVLEDFLEEHHVSMEDIAKKETEEMLTDCLELLAKCNYDYEKYKKEKNQTKQDDPNEHLEFMNDIKKLKLQINELKEKDKKTCGSSTEPQAAPTKETLTSQTSAEQNDGASANEKTQENPTETNKSNDKTNNKPSTNDKQNSSSEASSTASQSAEASQTPPDNSTSDNCSSSSSTSNNFKSTPHKPATSSSSSSHPPTNNIKQKDNDLNYDEDDSENDCKYRSFHYLYSFLQMAVFAFMGLTIRKLFFLCFTQGCVLASTICSSFMSSKNRRIFWTSYLLVFLTSVVNPGIKNLQEEYFPSSGLDLGHDDLDIMLEWIKMNTEKDAVFAGPIDIIGTVHLSTRRPIVNHAHLEMRQISQRTEHVYSVFSRLQSSDIYNQCSQLKIQYLIVTLNDCQNEISDECDLLSIWDDMLPAYRKYPQFCAELAIKNIPSFLKVFTSDYYAIIKMFSQSVQINLKYHKMPEKLM